MKLKIRAEKFGGIIFIPELRSTLHVDRDFMEHIGVKEFPELDHLTAPEILHLEITTKCPLNCRHCYSKQRGEMSKEELLRLVKLSAELGIFQITVGGGEPFCKDEIYEIAKVAKDYEIAFSVTTSGAVEIRKPKLFDQINVSLEACDRETYIKIRGCDYFDKAVETIKKLSEKVHVCANVVVTKHNFNQLSEICNFAEELGAVEVMLLRVKPVGRAEKSYEELRLSKEQLLKIDEVFNSLIDCGIAVRIDCAFSPFVEMDCIEGCDCGRSSISVKSDGTVTPCSFLEYELGKFEDLESIWHSMEAFRRDIQECIDCDKWEFCRGGCRVFPFKFGNAFAKDTECLRGLQL